MRNTTRPPTLSSQHREDHHPLNDDSSSSSSEEESDTTGSNNYAAKAEEPTEVIAKQETRAVHQQKLIVMMVLIVMVVAVATTVYFYVRRSEEAQFKAKFNDDYRKIFEGVGTSFDLTLGAYSSVAVTLASYATVAKQTWPFITMPDFAARMSKILTLSDAMYLDVLPIVKPEQRLDWEEYSVANDYWVNEGVTFQTEWIGYHGPVAYDGVKYGQIHGEDGVIASDVSRVMLPSWQTFPVIPNTTYTYNYDWYSSSNAAAAIQACLESARVTISAPYMNPNPTNKTQVKQAEKWANYFRDYINNTVETAMEPVSDFFYPIAEKASHINETDRRIVGVLRATFYWRNVLRNILPEDSNGTHVVVSNPCSESFTYEVNGPNVKFLGYGDLHETKYSNQNQTSTLSNIELSALNAILYTGAEMHTSFCPITLTAYPSKQMESHFITNNRYMFTSAAVGIFAFTSLVFYLYDLTVERRQEAVMKTAVRSTAIVSSLFPSEVRDRLFPVEDERARLKNTFRPDSAKGKIQSYLGNGMEEAAAGSTPIAELYPDTTVLFADISGFTAWSSVRQPTQVFQLLESVYSAFDEIAKKRGVFKVETIGDSYVAVAGLPTPRKHHAVVMARFANDCRTKMKEIVHNLDKMLGPGTADLAMRFGLNSGPTTAGVLRGEKSRFQLFGDTVNTAARMEANGERNKIQVTQKTADLIIEAGKGHWLSQRTERVECKGKGSMITYWCNPNAAAAAGSVGTASDNSQEDIVVGTVEAEETAAAAALKNLIRLVDWNFDMFLGLLNDIAVHRDANVNPSQMCAGDGLVDDQYAYAKPRDEISEVLLLPPTSKRKPKSEELIVPQAAALQLRDLIMSIATMYQANPFHNFDHASHVTMSTKKLMARIADEEEANEGSSRSVISSDPLTRFAIVFAALIHDVDHPGVSNGQLVEEKNPLAIEYEGKSVAEQNSVQLVWNLLMEPQFAQLRAVLFSTNMELRQFRQIIVNAVMATDLFDKDLKELRELRWEKSFRGSRDDTSSPSMSVDALNRRTTIVIVLIIQASDVSHTMQHFTVYKKWNQNLLTEMYDAYRCGRTAKNPLDGWYEGELWFFDNYVIPLAQKLRECGVFGVSCDEFLDYARDNRMEWENKGREIVAEAAEMLRLRPIPTTSTSTTQVKQSQHPSKSTSSKKKNFQSITFEL